MLCVVTIQQEINIAADSSCFHVKGKVRNNDGLSSSNKWNKGTGTEATPTKLGQQRRKKEERLTTSDGTHPRGRKVVCIRARS